jgi:hypothetical protein
MAAMFVSYSEILISTTDVPKQKQLGVSFSQFLAGPYK